MGSYSKRKLESRYPQKSAPLSQGQMRYPRENSPVRPMHVRRERIHVYLVKSGGPDPVDLANLPDDANFEKWESLFRRETEICGCLLPSLLGSYAVLRRGKSLPRKIANKPPCEQAKFILLTFRDILRKAWKADAFSTDVDSTALDDISRLAQGSAWWSSAIEKHIELIVDNPFGVLCVLFLRDYAAKRLGICANPDCQTPYFVKSRKTQKVCSAPECKVYSYQTSALNWWNREGKFRQISRKKRSGDPQTRASRADTSRTKPLDTAS
jgi:hypothetical protein